MNCWSGLLTSSLFHSCVLFSSLTYQWSLLHPSPCILYQWSLFHPKFLFDLLVSSSPLALSMITASSQVPVSSLCFISCCINDNHCFIPSPCLISLFQSLLYQWSLFHLLVSLITVSSLFHFGSVILIRGLVILLFSSI